jgi:hypothetical protein
MKLSGIIRVGFNVTCQLLIRFLLSSNSGEKWEIIHQLFIDSEKACDSVRREVLYNILIDFGVSMKLIRLIEICLHETYKEVCIGTHLCDTFAIQYDPK